MTLYYKISLNLDLSNVKSYLLLIWTLFILRLFFYTYITLNTLNTKHKLGFPDSSVGKESTCNAGHPGLIPESRKFTGEGKGYPFQYSWASIVAQLIKTLPVMWETWVWSLSWKNPLEKGNATHSRFLAWRIRWSMGSQSWTWLSNFHFTFHWIIEKSKGIPDKNVLLFHWLH